MGPAFTKTELIALGKTSMFLIVLHSVFIITSLSNSIFSFPLAQLHQYPKFGYFSLPPLPPKENLLYTVGREEPANTPNTLKQNKKTQTHTPNFQTKFYLKKHPTVILNISKSTEHVKGCKLKHLESKYSEFGQAFH